MFIFEKSVSCFMFFCFHFFQLQATIIMIKHLLDIIKTHTESLGIPAFLVNEIILIIVIVWFSLTVVSYLWKFFKWIKQWNERRILNNDLFPFFTKPEVYSLLVEHNFFLLAWKNRIGQIL